MALDLSKPLRRKGFGDATEARVLSGGFWAERALPSGRWFINGGLGCKYDEELENVPERRTLECCAAVLQKSSGGCLGVLWECEDDANSWMACHPANIHGCVKQVTIEYEVGEGLS